MVFFLDMLLPVGHNEKHAGIQPDKIIMCSQGTGEKGTNRTLWDINSMVFGEEWGNMLTLVKVAC
jgi:hypothetical protein